MAFFRKNRVIDEVRVAFSKVRIDISKLANWVEYFNKRTNFTDDKLNYLTELVSEERIRRIVKDAMQDYKMQPVERKNVSTRIMRTIKRQSKDYITHSILSLIQRYGQITALQLKDIIVDEQGLCSKSSFYRILRKIERSDDISVIRDGKEKKYLARILAQK